MSNQRASGTKTSQLWLPPGVLGQLAARQVLQGIKNYARMEGCCLLWRTDEAAIGICPGWDDFLVWLNSREEPPLVVPATPAVIQDFQVLVLPAIGGHRKASYAVELREYELVDGWALATMGGVITGEVEIGDIPEQSRIESDDPLYNTVATAHAAVIAALRDFTKRYNAQPEQL